jgi:SAM-dependent methyltransferase
LNLTTKPELPAGPEALLAPTDRLDWRIGLYDRCRTNPREWYRWAFDQITSRRDAHLMDFGCGTARFWHVNRDRIPAGWHVYLCDASRAMANRVQHGILPLPCSAAAIIADTTTIPFPDRSLDVILAMHVLHLVPDINTALRDFSRVLKIGGRLYATAGSLMRLKNLDAFGASCCPPVKILQKDPRERFSAENGKDILAANGFRQVRVAEYKDSIAFQELDTLIQYMRGTDGVSPDAFEPPAFDVLRPFLEQSFQSDGHITIRNDAALFEATV